MYLQLSRELIRVEINSMKMNNNLYSYNEEEDEEEEDLSNEEGIRWKKSEEASQKHAVAERKRRKRINDHFNTLRLLFPNLHKRDKATVLTETVRRVKELKKMVAESGIDTASATLSSPIEFPTENDEATVCYNCDGSEGKTVKLTVCCEERPDFNRDLTEAIRSVKGKVVKAEMSTVGGRTKAVVVIWWPEVGGGGGENDIALLRRSLKAVVENRVGCDEVMGRILNGLEWAGPDRVFDNGKRARIYRSNIWRPSIYI